MQAPPASKLQAVAQDVSPKSTAINQDLPGSSDDVWEDVEDSESQDQMRRLEEKHSEKTLRQGTAIPFRSSSVESGYSPASRFPQNAKSSENGTPNLPSGGSLRSTPGFSHSPRFSEQGTPRLPSGGPSRSPPNFSQSPRISEKEIPRLPPESPSKYPSHATSHARQREGKVEPYGNSEERFSQPLRHAAESVQSVNANS